MVLGRIIILALACIIFRLQWTTAASVDQGTTRSAGGTTTSVGTASSASFGERSTESSKQGTTTHSSTDKNLRTTGSSGDSATSSKSGSKSTTGSADDTTASSESGSESNTGSANGTTTSSESKSTTGSAEDTTTSSESGSESTTRSANETSTSSKSGSESTTGSANETSTSSGSVSTTGSATNSTVSESTSGSSETDTTTGGETGSTNSTANTNTDTSVSGTDCSDVMNKGNKYSGIYKIQLLGENSEPFDVFCDMATDGGGWTIFQRRGDFIGAEKDTFEKTWDEYKNGFGNLKREFWLGNDKIFALSTQDWYELRVDLWDLKSRTAYALYDMFYIESENGSYQLHLGGYSGNAGDALSYHKNMNFSTKDRDNDMSTKLNCAVRYHGAWWYKDCLHSNLNGDNLQGPNRFAEEGIVWNEWRGPKYSLAFSEMKIRRRLE